LPDEAKPHADRRVIARASAEDGGFFFVWTLFALSTAGWFTMILSARGLWQAFRARRSRIPAGAGDSHRTQ
jgi:hypothetical protein